MHTCEIFNFNEGNVCVSQAWLSSVKNSLVNCPRGDCRIYSCERLRVVFYELPVLLLHRFATVCLERRMAEAENTRGAARTDEARWFRQGSYGTLGRARSSTTSTAGEAEHADRWIRSNCVTLSTLQISWSGISFNASETAAFQLETIGKISPLEIAGGMFRSSLQRILILYERMFQSIRMNTSLWRWNTSGHQSCIFGLDRTCQSCNLFP